jgi:hypothetical protein
LVDRIRRKTCAQFFGQRVDFRRRTHRNDALAANRERRCKRSIGVSREHLGVDQNQIGRWRLSVRGRREEQHLQQVATHSVSMLTLQSLQDRGVL